MFACCIHESEVGLLLGAQDLASAVPLDFSTGPPR